MLLAILSLLAPAHAIADDMVLYNLRSVQQLEHAAPSTTVTSDAQMVWDTRKDGIIPKDAPIGYADRVVTNGIPSLKENAIMKAAKLKADQDAAAKALQDAADESAYRAAVDKINAGTAQLSDLSAALKFMNRRRAGQ